MRLLIKLFAGYILFCTALVLLSINLVQRCDALRSHFDVAVVLGGGSTTDGLSIDSAARVIAGVRLYQTGTVDSLLMTGAGALGQASTAKAMARKARDMSVDSEGILVEPASQSTLQNARFSLEILPEDTRLIVVTEPFHALRGAASFLWAGKAVSVCATPKVPRPGQGTLRARVREVAAWAVNIPRAAGWTMAAWLVPEDRLPLWILQ
ncbi:uncharacterized SAM-binding protein YcdF (DUF218 family) [Sagittula marina]|uniref:Uncharacterized SAM-binding protein YcdF (DUF218 family) n=1 Tax=Sagittula marina TaxID=943940 RepID=A0A7W6DVB8_9RHOB|nr:YdcF family protein [Sagittula marina]MBB3986803.1 uncharacterized SAM-binding protein YcdF (DUF218 family) [Sagittula marina]